MQAALCVVAWHGVVWYEVAELRDQNKTRDEGASRSVSGREINAVGGGLVLACGQHGVLCSICVFVCVYLCFGSGGYGAVFVVVCVVCVCGVFVVVVCCVCVVIDVFVCGWGGCRKPV